MEGAEEKTQWSRVVPMSTQEKASRLSVTTAPARDSVLLFSQGIYPQADRHTYIYSHTFQK